MKNLKTVFAAVIVLLLLNSNSFAQKGQSSSGNCVEEGTIIIDAFYGYPYFNGAVLKALFSNTVGNVRNTNHLGAKVEYMVTDEIGLGVEFTYAHASISYRDSLYRTSTAEISKLRVLAKMNFHFATDANIDPYLTVGAGIKQNKFEGFNGVEWTGNLYPVAARIGVGLRYFFTDVVGVNAEVGLGGPLMQGGVSFRF
ncbi:MAG: outer membrane beta-barrel protein [Bacteroidota bacterium]